MALPIAAYLGKGVVLAKGATVKRLAKSGIKLVSAKALANQFTKKQKKELEKSSEKKGIEVDFDYDISNKTRSDFRLSNRKGNKGGHINYDIQPRIAFRLGFNRKTMQSSNSKNIKPNKRKTNKSNKKNPQ